jgi:serine/threonine protein kinase/class 3 adenylate cyclase
MTPADYELVAQLGAGVDGVAYRARRISDGQEVELQLLAGARRDDVHWQRLVRRLRLVRLLDHPGARRVLDMDLDKDPPWIALAPNIDRSEPRPLRAPTAREGLREQPIDVAFKAIAILLAAHRLGLAHGALTPETFSHFPLRIDFTRTATCEDQSPLSASSPTALADDVAALGALFQGLFLETSFPTLRTLLGEMQAPDPGDRPTLAVIESRLREVARLSEAKDALVTTRLAEPAPAAAAHTDVPQQLGRYRLEEKLGQGGMGAVYRAVDTSDGRTVAIKTLLPEHTRRPEMVRRFLKEARLLAEVNNPFVANLLEVNEDQGLHYLAVEFVAGKSAGALLDDGKPIEESYALSIIADCCRALVAAHQHGIVHRDIKPDNILLLAEPSSDGDQVAKLSDFGLARHVIESESLHLTRTGAVVGTPLYLSPEQCAGGLADPRSDVYSCGATLFHLLAGRPPYLADAPLAVMQMHCQEPVPSLKAFVSTASEGLCRLVEKALAKSLAHRHADASELLLDIQRLRRGEPIGAEAHPRLPATDSTRVVQYDFSWELESPAAELWPYVSNTERLNRAINLPVVQWTTSADSNGALRRQGQVRKFGLEVGWQEHPFEWIEGRRFGVLREMSAGPFRWLLSVVELMPRAGGGTTLTHRIRLEPKGILGRTFAAVEVGIRTRRALERIYKRIDVVLRGRADLFTDPFEEPASLTRAQQRRLDEGLDRLAQHRVDPTIVERLGVYLATGPAQEVARIRPLALARRLKLDPQATVSACLYAARDGLLVPMWDLLCPLCRIPSEIHTTLKALKEHGRCEACNLNYELDFDQSVEMIFRVDPAIREVELGMYCIGGPAHSPHVVAQVRVAPHETLELPLDLTPGAYKLRGPQLPGELEARIEPGCYPSRWEVHLGRLKEKERMFLRPGGQMLELVNPHGQELVVRLERTIQRDDALTAARAATLSLFRELFPGEVLSPGQLVRIATVTLLVTEIADLDRVSAQEGEAKAFELLHEHLRELEALARTHGGALVKAVGEGALLAFGDSAAALRAMLEINDQGRVRLVLHRGPALATTINDQLDYFGLTVRQALAMLAASAAGDRLISESVMAEPSVSALLHERGVITELSRVLPRGAERKSTDNSLLACRFRKEGSAPGGTF